MLFKTLIIAFASSSLAQTYSNDYDHGYSNDYGKNYASSQQNTLSRRACYIDEYGVQHCTPPPQPEYNDDYSHNYLARRACTFDKYGNPLYFTPEPVVEPKEPIRKNCRPGSCWTSENGQEVCDRSEVCELVQPKY